MLGVMPFDARYAKVRRGIFKISAASRVPIMATSLFLVSVMRPVLGKNAEFGKLE